MPIHPFLDYILDQKSEPVNKEFYIVTSGNDVLKVFPEPKPSFLVYTPSISTCNMFGAWTQHQEGFQTHGHSKQHKVRRPYVGQSLYFWTNWLHRTTWSGQTIQRLYFEPCGMTVDGIRQIFNHFENVGNQLSLLGLEIMQEYPRESGYNRLLSFLVSGVVLTGASDWTITKEQFNSLNKLSNTQAFGNVGTEWLIDAVFIIEEHDCYRLSEGLIIKLMIAINDDRSMATKFDEKGRLVLK